MRLYKVLGMKKSKYDKTIVERRKKINKKAFYHDSM